MRRTLSRLLWRAGALAALGGAGVWGAEVWWAASAGGGAARGANGAERNLPAVASEGPRLEGSAASPPAPVPAEGPANEQATGTYRLQVEAGDAAAQRTWIRVRERGDPLERALTLTPDAEGLVTFPWARPNDVVVEVFRDGIRLRTEWLYEPEGIEAPAQRLDVEPGIPIEGRVVGQADGRPLAGVLISVVPHGEGAIPLGRSDADGAFRVPGVRDNAQTVLRAEMQGFAGAEIEANVQNGRPAEPFVLTLVPAGTLSVTVVGPDGAAVEGAEVTVFKVDADGDVAPPVGEPVDPDVHRPWERGLAEWTAVGAENGERTTDRGTLRVGGLPLGVPLWAGASAPGQTPSLLTPFRLPPGTAETSVRLAVRPAARLRVRLLDERGAALPTTRDVSLWTRRLEREAVGCEPDGCLLFLASAGEAVLVVARDDYLPTERQVELAAGATQDVEVRLERGVGMEGFVVDVEGQPVANADVSVSPRETEPLRRTSCARETRTDRDGRFSVEGLPPGPVDVQAHTRLSGDCVRRETLVPVRATAPATDVRVVVLASGGARIGLVTPDGLPYVGDVWSSLEVNRSGSDNFLTISEGRLRWPIRVAGEVRWTVAPTGYAWFQRATTLESPGSVDFGDVVLTRGLRAVGQVLDAAGRPLAGADVRCVEVPIRRLRTDAEGRFAFDAFPDRFALSVELAGFVPDTHWVERSEAQSIVVRLFRACTWSGVLLDAEGRPVPETRLELRWPDDRQIEGTWLDARGGEASERYRRESEGIETGADGRFEREEAPAGPRQVIWTDPATGLEHRLADLNVAPGARQEVEFRLPAR